MVRAVCPSATRDAPRARPVGRTAVSTKPDGALSAEGRRYLLGPALHRPFIELPRRREHQPLWRRLRVYAVDPAVPRRDGAIATVQVPYDDLQPGPVGVLFEVDPHDGARGLTYRRADLDDRQVLLADGYEPSPSDPRFHQQMVYAVCRNLYRTFRVALGRFLDWGFERGSDCGRLRLRPHAFAGANAYYDPVEGAINFGYTQTTATADPGTLPQGYVFTCLSHDVIAHEFTHAVLDGLRSQFKEPSGPDVIAFHEAFADLVAVFKRFSHTDTVRAALAASRGSVENAALLTDLARQIGYASGDLLGNVRALRSAIGEAGAPRIYDETLEPHDLGAVLVAAVFEAFITVYRRKTRRLLRLATQGSGELPTGDLPHDLQVMLAERASRLADQFLRVCIRAVDYCPPVDLRFGEYLRALITADHDLVREDPWGYREALVDAFARRRIYPRHVPNLSEDALRWKRPESGRHVIAELSFAELKFNGDPACPMDEGERRRQARVLGEYLSRPENLEDFGLVAAGHPALEGDAVSLPCVQSVRSSRRVGPDDQVVFDLVAEVTQRRDVRAGPGRAAFSYHGGATVILDAYGEVRYVIKKSVIGAGRRERRAAFVEGPVAQRYWQWQGDRRIPRRAFLRLLDDRPAPAWP